jgi:hypothetical protein
MLKFIFVTNVLKKKTLIKYFPRYFQSLTSVLFVIIWRLVQEAVVVSDLVVAEPLHFPEVAEAPHLLMQMAPRI